MGLIKDSHGSCCAQQKVPARLQAAVAQVLGNGKPRPAYLKKSLGTEDFKAANIMRKARAHRVRSDYSRCHGDCIKSAAPPAMRSSLNAAETARMSEALYGKLLADDEAFRFSGRAFVAAGVDVIALTEYSEKSNFFCLART